MPLENLPGKDVFLLPLDTEKPRDLRPGLREISSLLVTSLMGRQAERGQREEENDATAVPQP